MSAISENLQPLFEPLAIGAVKLRNRVLMAPLTRNRAHRNGVPKSMAVEYYRQRADAGLIISEATQISAEGKGYKDTPGIYTPAQVAGWKAVTDAVHAEGGKIFCQLWHVGRISHTSLQEHGKAPVAPSAVAAKAYTYTEAGFAPTSEPRALEAREIPRLIREYVHAARCAIEAGFDGVEVHGANGYLIDQFLHGVSNHRTDAYGRDAEGRTRLLFEVCEAVANAIGADRTGVRLSPTGTFNDVGSTDVEKVFGLAIRRLNPLGLAYLHVVEQFPGMPISPEERALLGRLRVAWKGVYIANGDLDGPTAAARVKAGTADAATFGRPFIANPDLPRRLAEGAPLNTPNPDTFYGGDERGYTDYPALADAAA